MITHVMYGVFGLLAASVIALAIYLDKPAPHEASPTAEVEESELEGGGDEQSASVVIAGESAERYEVVKVIDGDTIEVSKAGETETVRMIGLNAPETGQCYTNEAAQKLKSLLGGSTVVLELDASQGERDKYDRLLAYVFNKLDINTAEALIEGGFAKEYTYSRPYKYQSEFKAAQSRAQTAGKGLWAPGVCATAAPAQPAPVVQQASTPVPPQTQTVKKVEPKIEPKEEPEEEEAQEEEEDDPPASQGNYTCSSNTYNCDSFSTHAEAQAAFEACGGPASDIHRLDGNKDGLACESLP